MKNKVYVVTGATSGIGNALLKELAQENIVYAGYRDENKVDDLKQISENVRPFYIDYSLPETISIAYNKIKLEVRKIDTLINIAGCVVAGPVEKIEISEIKHQFDVNVFGHLEFSLGLIDRLDSGKIINISSMASYGIFPFISPYCASKRTLDMFFNSLLLETKKNISIVSIKPGVIATPLWGKSVENNKKYIDKCAGFEKEMQFLIDNALNNEKKGLSVQKVVKVILKADNARKPKLTYTVGHDAFVARFVSKLPQAFVNKIVKARMKAKFH